LEELIQLYVKACKETTKMLKKWKNTGFHNNFESKFLKYSETVFKNLDEAHKTNRGFQSGNRVNRKWFDKAKERVAAGRTMRLLKEEEEEGDSVEEIFATKDEFKMSNLVWKENPYRITKNFPYKNAEETFPLKQVELWKDGVTVELGVDFEHEFETAAGKYEQLVCIYLSGEPETGNWVQCDKTRKTDSSVTCSCPENVYVTMVNDVLNLYNTAAVDDETTVSNVSVQTMKNTLTTQSTQQGTLEVVNKNTKVNFNALIPFIATSAIFAIVIVIGIYLDTDKESKKIIPTDSLGADEVNNCKSRFTNNHSVVEIFKVYDFYTPRMLRAMLVYARMIALFAVAGALNVNNFAIASSIAALVGVAVALNLVNRILYILYKAANESVIQAKKNPDGQSLFKGRMGKYGMVTLTTAYVALSIYGIFNNAASSMLIAEVAAAFVAAVVIDLVAVDSTFAFVWSAFFKRQPLA